GLLLGELLGGEAAQAVVDQRQQLLGRVGVALLDGGQNARDVSHWRYRGCGREAVCRSILAGCTDRYPHLHGRRAEQRATAGPTRERWTRPLAHASGSDSRSSVLAPTTIRHNEEVPMDTLKSRLAASVFFVLVFAGFGRNGPVRGQEAPAKKAGPRTDLYGEP